MRTSIVSKPQSVPLVALEKFSPTKFAVGMAVAAQVLRLLLWAFLVGFLVVFRGIIVCSLCRWFLDFTIKFVGAETFDGVTRVSTWQQTVGEPNTSQCKDTTVA
jgi:hypothetical protein